MLDNGILSVKMDSHSQTPVFTVNDIVKFGEKTCMITDIDNKLGFRQYVLVDVDSGAKHRAARYQLKESELAAALIPADFLENMDFTEETDPTPPPNVDSTVPKSEQRWADVSEADLNSLAENRHSSSTANQTKWAVKAFRGWFIISCLDYICYDLSLLYRCKQINFQLRCHIYLFPVYF